MPPAQRIRRASEALRDGRRATPAEREAKISEQLAASIRTEKDPLIRVEIIRALGQYPGPAADAILKAALSDTETNVRVAACEAWGHGATPRRSPC